MNAPQIIHQVWFQGEDAVPSNYAQAARKLRDMNPDWQYILWTDATLQDACARVGPEVLARYRSFPHMHQKIDLGRYVALYLNGGISIDMDVDAIRPLSALPPLTADLVVSNVPVKAWENYAFSFGARTRIYNNATVLATPNHPALRALIDDIVDGRDMLTGPMAALGKGLFGQVWDIQHTTGPLAFSNSLDRSGEKFQVLDNVYVEPCYGRDMHCAPDPRTVLFHRHAATWFPPFFVKLSELFYFLRPVLPLLLLLLVVWLVMRRWSVPASPARA